MPNAVVLRPASLFLSAPVAAPVQWQPTRRILFGTLFLIVLLNFCVRRYLDDAKHTVPSFLETVYKDQLPAIDAHSWWQYFLPIKE